jgi:hypothetical protein
MTYPLRTPCWFIGYREKYPDDLLPSELVVIVGTDGEDVYLVLRITSAGYAVGRDTRLVFKSEIMPLPSVPIPLWRLPPPYGTLGDYGPSKPNQPWPGPIW